VIWTKSAEGTGRATAQLDAGRSARRPAAMRLTERVVHLSRLADAQGPDAACSRPRGGRSRIRAIVITQESWGYDRGVFATFIQPPDPAATDVIPNRMPRRYVVLGHASRQAKSTNSEGGRRGRATNDWRSWPTGVSPRFLPLTPEISAPRTRDEWMVRHGVRVYVDHRRRDRLRAVCARAGAVSCSYPGSPRFAW
jgi:hypothetical protein